MNENQKLALDQLESIEIEDKGNFEIIDYSSVSGNDDSLVINISIPTKLYEKTKEGFNFRPRERFRLIISKDFPYEIPVIQFSDFRYRGKPHVQWGSILCLFQAPDVEWDPADGMFGYMSRLDLYLKKAAINQLDPNDAPLHPPVAYTSSKVSYKIIPNSDAPDFNGKCWQGTAKLEKLNNECFFIPNWYELKDIKSRDNYAAVILLSDDMPFEYPYYFRSLLFLLKNRGIEIFEFIRHLQTVIKKNKSGKSLFIVIGTPMRGSATNRKQHLLCWYLEAKVITHLRGFDANKFKSNRDKASEHLDKFINYAAKAKIHWCSVLENRPEIIIPRDKDTFTSYFSNKKIEIWGCGALGSHIAEIIMRSKPNKLLLFDNGIVKPGLLSRQLFYENDIGNNKADSLKNRISKIHQSLNFVDVKAFNKNVLKRMDEKNWWQESDIIIDTTASKKVLRKLDSNLIKEKIQKEILSLVIDSSANKGMLIVRDKNSILGMTDIIRQSRLHLHRNKDKTWLPHFFPGNSDISKTLFQPEPGCSDPTFTGSEADLSILAGLLINSASRLLAKPSFTRGCIFVSHNLYNNAKENYYEINLGNCSSDFLLTDPVNNYKVLFKDTIVNKIMEIVRKENKSRKKDFETGGLIFGEWDDLNKVVYVDEISPQPNDSIASENNFECGIEGTRELNQNIKKESENTSYFVGLWHSHPFGSADYSGKDKKSMKLVVTELCPPKSLMLIIAYNEKEQNLMGFVFDKSQFNN